MSLREMPGYKNFTRPLDYGVGKCHLCYTACTSSVLLRVLDLGSVLKAMFF